MKQIKKKKKNNIKSLLILLIVLLSGILLLGAIQKKQDVRSSAAGYLTCSGKDLTGKVLYGTCSAFNPTGTCSTSTGYNGKAIKGLCPNSPYYCCLPDTGKLPGAEACYSKNGVCILAFGSPKDGTSCTYNGSSGTYASGLCMGTYGAIDYKCCKLNPTPRPSCASKSGVCLSSVRTCTIAESGTVITGTTCSGTTPVCCRL